MVPKAKDLSFLLTLLIPSFNSKEPQASAWVEPNLIPNQLFPRITRTTEDTLSKITSSFKALHNL